MRTPCPFATWFVCIARMLAGLEESPETWEQREELDNAVMAQEPVLGVFI